MKLIYSDPKIEEEIKVFASKTGAEPEFRKDLAGMIEDFREANKGKAIGTPIPESFVDLGRYLFAFFLGALASGIAYDLVKTAVKNLLFNSKDKTSKKFDYFLISDGEDPNKFEENIYFFIPTNLTEAEGELCLDEIEKIINAVNELKNSAHLSGSLRFYYIDNNARSYHGNKLFALREIAKSS